MNQTGIWQRGAAIALVLLTVALVVRQDYQSLLWAKNLSAQGSPAPQLEVASPSGYALGQRHFIATNNRGSTYRWIAYVQELRENGPFADSVYMDDASPAGRPQLLPKLYAGWIATIAGVISIAGDQPFPIAVETAALWEPILSHAIALLLLVAFIARRFTILSGAAAGILFALFPFFTVQFIPGSIDSDRWALLLAAFAIAISIPSPKSPQSLRPLTAILAGLALWLDPKFGFVAVMLIAIFSSFSLGPAQAKIPYLKWASVGAGISLCGWLIDQNPFALEASELRYNHPLYAIAWLGLGLGLDGIQSIASHTGKKNLALSKLAIGIPLLLALFYAQFKNGYLGWLHSAAETQRLSDLRAPLLFENAIAWIASSATVEVVFIFLLPIAALATQLLRLRSSKESGDGQTRNTIACLSLIGILALLTYFKIRWALTLSLVSIPLLCQFGSQLKLEFSRYLYCGAAVIFMIGLFAWNKNLPASLHRSAGSDPLRSSDLEALVQRHLSHWIASHNPTREVHALASPSQSDSLIFHGGCQAILSSAWESYPGQIAASRVLSAPENTEVQAILESREVTHILLSSWDRILPQLVQQAPDNGSTFYQRLQIWILPLFLRPIPYHLPPISGFETEKLAVFEMAPVQDEALSMSRLTEYFIEMRRPEPASLAAKTLEQSYSEDPNAQIAQTFFATDSKDILGLRKHSSELANDVQTGLVPMDWDRRVLRAIALALGKQHTLAKPEIEACLASMSEETLYQLTALQSFQLLSIAKSYQLPFPDKSLETLARKRCYEYLP